MTLPDKPTPDVVYFNIYRNQLKIVLGFSEVFTNEDIDNSLKQLKKKEIIFLLENLNNKIKQEVSFIHLCNKLVVQVKYKEMITMKEKIHFMKKQVQFMVVNLFLQIHLRLKIIHMDIK